MESFLRVQLPGLFNWIPGKIRSYAAWKPAIRCAVTGWICLVLFLIIPLARSLGQAAFFVIIVSILYPPLAPLEIAVEQLLTMLLMVGLAWLWGVIACAIAEAVRIAPTAETLALYASRYPGLAAATVDNLIIFDGAFLSLPSSAVYAVFLGCGSTFFLYIKAYDVKLALPAVLACILLDIICSYGALVPGFTNAAPLGAVFYKPMCLYVAVALLTSCVVFPQSVQDKFIQTLATSIETVHGITALQKPLLATSPFSAEWLTFRKMSELRANGSAAYQAMMMGKPSLTREFCFGRLRGQDLQKAEEKIRILIARAGGLHAYYELLCSWIKMHNEMHAHDSESSSKSHLDEPSEKSGGQAVLSTGQELSKPDDSGLKARHADAAEIHNLSGGAHHHAHFERRHQLKPVGVFESVRYMHVEARFVRPGDKENLIEMTSRLGTVCDELIDACSDGILAALQWFKEVNEDRLLMRLGLGHLTLTKLASKIRQNDPSAKSASAKPKQSLNVKKTHEDLRIILAQFIEHKRNEILEPYHKYFARGAHSPDLSSDELSNLSFEHQSHRGLFYSVFYQFELIQFAKAVSGLLAYVNDLELNKGSIRLQKPHFKGLMDLLNFSNLQDAGQDDEDPEEIAGMHVFEKDVEARDPDAGFARTPLQWIIKVGARLLRSATQGNLWFAIRAGTVTVLITLPQYFPASARFFYYNRGLWAIIMAQLTLQRWTGDTILQYLFRVVMTFAGAVLGMLLWYIGSASGIGNPFGLAAVAAVAYPFLFFYRVNTPPMNTVPTIILVVTAGLVLGYSYQDGLGGFSLVDTGIGWEVAWKRFVVVLVGITAAFMASFLPPESSRRQVRRTLAKTLQRLGEVYMELLSFAQRTHKKPDLLIIRNVISINSKLRIFLPQRLLTGPYEFKAGPWPKQKYVEIQRLQLEMSDLLAQLMVVYLSIDSKWREILLLRTRLLDPKFIGEITAVFWMLSTALASGRPLPAVTPCPLIDRSFMIPWWTHLRKNGNPSRSGSAPSSRAASQMDLVEAFHHNQRQGAEPHNDMLQKTKQGSGANYPDQKRSSLQTRSSSRASQLELDTPPTATPLESACDETITLALLQDEGYMAFSAGATLSFALIYRIDQLMKVVKELVGEGYLVRELNVDALEGRYSYHV